MTIRCVVVDAGARYGLHPTWSDMKEVAEFHLFEMDEIEAVRLARKYSGSPNITVYPVALYSRDTTLQFHVSEHRALNSLLESNQKLLERNEYMIKEFEVNERRTVNARSLDSMLRDQEIHFMKLDVEGAELDLLEGARQHLQRSVLGVRSEVLFSPIYVGAPLFGDINSHLLAEGFELLNLDYTGAGNKAGRFTLPGRYGKLLSTDAVWIVSEEKLFSTNGTELSESVVRMALFLISNNATDLAIELLVRAVTREGASLSSYRDDPLFQKLHRKVLYLFKSLLAVPQLSSKDVMSTYQTIFGRDFPAMNQFYESDMFD